MKPLSSMPLFFILFISLFICVSWPNWQSIYLYGLGGILSYYDLKSQEYPVIIWLIGTAILLLFQQISVTFVIIMLLGLLSLVTKIPIGAGDFFYLASLSLVLNLQPILSTIQIASLLGIGYYLLKLNHQKTIAFIPFLTMGYAIVCWIG